MTDIDDSVSTGDNYSRNEIVDSPGSAIGRGAHASATIHGISGEQLEILFTRVHDIIDRVDAAKGDKQTLTLCAEELKNELQKKKPDVNIVERCWAILKEIPKIASVLGPVIEALRPPST